MNVYNFCQFLCWQFQSGIWDLVFIKKKHHYELITFFNYNTYKILTAYPHKRNQQSNYQVVYNNALFISCNKYFNI